MRYAISALILAALAGCAIAPSGTGRVYYDRKYNTYYQLRSQQPATTDRSAAPVYDRKYNTYLPSRS